MSNVADLSPMKTYSGSSNEIIGFGPATTLLAFGGGCLLVVLIFGIILCRLDVSAGKSRRSREAKLVEN